MVIFTILSLLAKNIYEVVKLISIVHDQKKKTEAMIDNLKKEMKNLPDDDLPCM